MKSFITILVLCSPLLAFSAENCSTTEGTEVVDQLMEIKTDVPKYLEGATIIVRLKDGKETAVPAEKFKVVARKQQYLVSRTLREDKTICSAEINKNRVSLNLGQGPKGTLSTSKTASKVEVESQVGIVGGLQYQRLITDKISISGQIQNNNTGLLGVGLDF